MLGRKTLRGNPERVFRSTANYDDLFAARDASGRGLGRAIPRHRNGLLAFLRRLEARAPIPQARSRQRLVFAPQRNNLLLVY